MQPPTTLLLLFVLLVAGGVLIVWLTRCQRKGKQGRQTSQRQEAPQEQEEAPIGHETWLAGKSAQSIAAPEGERQAAEETVSQQTRSKELSGAKIAAPEEPETLSTQTTEQNEEKNSQHRESPNGKQEVAKSDETEGVAVQGPGQIEGEHVQPWENEKPTPRVKEGRREPVDRGGRPRGSTQPRKRRVTREMDRETVSRYLKPEIICWKRERQWFIGLEVPEELLREGNDLKVYQQGKQLSPDEMKKGCWLLRCISGRVTVQGGKVNAAQEIKEKEMEIDLGQTNYLLFKLSGQDLKQGRLVRSASSGSYLVIAPEGWKRDEAIGGSPPAAPELVALDGYLAHFFELEKGKHIGIAFYTSEGKPISISQASTYFELSGERIEDATEKIGPLFNEPPKISAVGPQGWEGINTIVVGEEGSGRGRWRAAFRPNPDSKDQDLPTELLERNGGWYFLRFYDGNDNLVESLDFRFLSGLKQIKFFDSSLFPVTSDGHRQARVEIVHDREIVIHPAEKLPGIQIEQKASRTFLTIPSDPQYDITRWQIGYQDGPQVQVTISVERIWWALGEEETEPSNWIDQPIRLSRDDFSATSKKAVWLRFPKKRWVSRVLVGFQRSKARAYPVKVTENSIAVPLREFSDSQVVADRAREHQLRVWIECNGELEGTLAILPALETVTPAHQWIGIGRYKTALAKAILQQGSGEITINSMVYKEYFKNAPRKGNRFLQRLLELPQVADALTRLEADVEVWGSCPTTMRQIKAITHALAHALSQYDPKLGPLVKRAGFGGVKIKNYPQKARGSGHR